MSKYEALDMKTPGEVHDFKARPFVERVPHFDYDSNMKVQRVTNNRALRWKTFFWVYVTVSLKRKYVGNSIWTVYYRGD